MELRELTLQIRHVDGVPLVKDSWMDLINDLAVGVVPLIGLREEALLEFVELLVLELQIVTASSSVESSLCEVAHHARGVELLRRVATLVGHLLRPEVLFCQAGHLRHVDGSAVLFVPEGPGIRLLQVLRLQ